MTFCVSLERKTALAEHLSVAELVYSSSSSSRLFLLLLLLLLLGMGCCWGL
jgi:hypothetical protein